MKKLTNTKTQKEIADKIGDIVLGIHYDCNCPDEGDCKQDKHNKKLIELFSFHAEQLITAHDRELVERITKLKTKPLTDHTDKDEWYDCITCMDETNIDSTIDKAVQLIREGEDKK